jgi:hypothetical protein
MSGLRVWASVSEHARVLAMPVRFLMSPVVGSASGLCATVPPASTGQRAVRTIRVTIAHPQRLFRSGLRALLEREASIAVVDEAATADEAVAPCPPIAAGHRADGRELPGTWLCRSDAADPRRDAGRRDAAGGVGDRRSPSASRPGTPSQATRMGGSDADPEGHRGLTRICASECDRSRQGQCHFTPGRVRARWNFGI